MKTRIIMHELHNLLNMLKGFTAGYKSSNGKEMLIEKEGQVYKITIEEIGEGSVEDFIDNTI